MLTVVPWSRILSNREVLCAVNTDPDRAATTWVTIENSLHNTGDSLTCVFSTDQTMLNKTIMVQARNGKAVQLTVPPAGFVVYR